MITVVMVFRIYALYGQSRRILGVLLFIYFGEVVISIISGVIYTKPGAVVGKSNHSIVFEANLHIYMYNGLFVQ